MPGAKLGPLVAEARGYSLDVRKGFHGQRVLQSQFLARAHLLGRPPEGEGLNVEGEDQVGTQTGNRLIHIVIQAADDRRNADHYRHPNHNTEHRKPGTQLVVANGVQRHLYGFAVVAFTHSEI